MVHRYPFGDYRTLYSLALTFLSSKNVHRGMPIVWGEFRKLFLSVHGVGIVKPIKTIEFAGSLVAHVTGDSFISTNLLDLHARIQGPCRVVLVHAFNSAQIVF